MTDRDSSFRAVGLDLGDARIGLAVSDPLGTIAQPLDSIRRIGPRKDLQHIAERVVELGADVVVVGLPLLMSGEEGAQARKAREFAEALQRRLPRARVELWDERLTTVQAQRNMVSGGVKRGRRKRSVDPVAAALILQGYLDARRGGHR